MFFLVDEFTISTDDYSKNDLRNKYYQLQQNSVNGYVCVKRYRDRNLTNLRYGKCTSNTTWQLPITVNKETYKLDENGNLSIKSDARNSTYTIKNGKLLSDEKMNVYYEFY